MRKPVFGVSDQVPHKPGCTATEDGYRLEISDLGSIRVAKTKALISFEVTAKLICVFVFAYAKNRFSHDVSQLRVTQWFSRYVDYWLYSVEQTRQDTEKRFSASFKAIKNEKFP